MTSCSYWTDEEDARVAREVVEQRLIDGDLTDGPIYDPNRLKDERNRYRTALEIIAHRGPAARAAYYDRNQGLPTSYAGLQKIAEKALDG